MRTWTEANRRRRRPSYANDDELTGEGRNRLPRSVDRQAKRRRLNQQEEASSRPPTEELSNLSVTPSVSLSKDGAAPNDEGVCSVINVENGQIGSGEEDELESAKDGLEEADGELRDVESEADEEEEVRRDGPFDFRAFGFFPGHQRRADEDDADDDDVGQREVEEDDEPEESAGEEDEDQTFSQGLSEPRSRYNMRKRRFDR